MANQPAYRYTEDVTGDVLVCQDRLYTITSGELWTVIHEGESASGNTNYTITVTPHQVVAVDGEGHEFSIVGAAWFGATLNANTGGFQGTDTLKLQVVGQGSGAVDSVNLTFHVHGTAQQHRGEGLRFRNLRAVVIRSEKKEHDHEHTFTGHHVYRWQPNRTCC
jgi:hypothetical protein